MLNLIIPYDFNYEKANLRDKIQYHLHKKGWKHSELALATGIHKSALSRMMNGERQFTFDQINKIEVSLGIERGELIQHLIEDCYDNNGSVKKGKISALLLECTKSERVEVVNKILNQLYNNSSSNAKIIFDSAEKLYNEGFFEQALPLYKTITQEVKNRLDSKLSVSHFRCFMIMRKLMVNKQRTIGECLDSLTLLLDYIERLPNEKLIIEAYNEIAVFYNFIEDYKNTLKYADRLIELCRDLKRNCKKGILTEQDLDKHYYETLIFKAFALRCLGRYDEALEVTAEYANYNEDYKAMSYRNTCLIKILQGSWEHINVYLQTSNDDKKLASMLSIVFESMLKHEKLNMMREFIENNTTLLDVLKGEQGLLWEKYRMKTYQYLSEYYLKTGQNEQGIDLLLESMRTAQSFNNHSRLKQCWFLYTTFAAQVSTEKQNEIQIILRDIL